MPSDSVKIRAIDSSLPVHHLVNQPVRAFVAGPRASRETAAKSTLRLVPGSGKQAGAERRATDGASERRGSRPRLLDAAFFLLALGAAAAMWWSVTVN